MEMLWNALSGKIVSFSFILLLTDKGTTIWNGWCFFERINRISNLTAQLKFLHNFNLERLFFKTLWGFFDMLSGCLAIYQSSVLTDDKHCVRGHCRMSISKTRNPPHANKNAEAFCGVLVDSQQNHIMRITILQLPVTDLNLFHWTANSISSLFSQLKSEVRGSKITPTGFYSFRGEILSPFRDEFLWILALFSFLFFVIHNRGLNAERYHEQLKSDVYAIEI